MDATRLARPATVVSVPAAVTMGLAVVAAGMPATAAADADGVGYASFTVPGIFRALYLPMSVVKMSDTMTHRYVGSGVPVTANGLPSSAFMFSAGGAGGAVNTKYAETAPTTHRHTQTNKHTALRHVRRSDQHTNTHT